MSVIITKHRLEMGALVKEPKKLKIGTRVKIISGGCGAYGCNGMTGVITTREKFTNGSSSYGVCVETDEGGVWGVTEECELRLIND